MKTPEHGETWGILGGTFDPIHNGHLSIASHILKYKNLDGIILIPSSLHPFKNNKILSSYNDRIEMSQLATASLSSFLVSTIEKDENLSGYSIDTIKAVKTKYSKTTFYFLIGADNIEQLSLWHKIDELFQEIKILVGKRPQFEMNRIQNDFSASLEYIETEEIDISSTEIKNLISQRKLKKLKTFLHPDVLQYIQDKELYLI